MRRIKRGVKNEVKGKSQKSRHIKEMCYRFLFIVFLFIVDCYLFIEEKSEE